MNASDGSLKPPARAAGGACNLRHWIATIPKIVVATLLILAMVDLLIGVFLRYVVVAFTDYFDLPTVSFFWVEEAGEFALAWLTLVGAAVAITERTHFELSVFVHRLSARAQIGIDRLNHLLIAAFGAFVMVFGWGISASNTMLTSPGLEINLAWLYASSAVGGALIVIYGLAVALGLARRREMVEPGGP
jgi:TRAP-type C4-dicarboxylate transport system permease small subunit